MEHRKQIDGRSGRSLRANGVQSPSGQDAIRMGKDAWRVASSYVEAQELWFSAYPPLSELGCTPEARAAFESIHQFWNDLSWRGRLRRLLFLLGYRIRRIGSSRSLRKRSQ